MAYLFVHIRIEVAYEQVGTYVDSLLVCRGFVDANGLAIHLDHVENLDGLCVGGYGLLVAVEWEAGWESPCSSIAHNIHSLHRLRFCTPQSHSPDVDL